MKNATHYVRRWLPLAVAAFFATPSYAVDLMRKELPIVAGTELYFANGEGCTAGLVVRSTSFWSNITTYQRAIRYVVTAGHCASVGEDVTVGGVRGVGGRVVGKVAWVSSTSDLALIRIEPSATRFQHCGHVSTAVSCVIGVDFEPRAVGRVFLSSLAFREVVALPVTAIGAPSQNQQFCTSGAITGVNCTWTSAAPIPGWQHPAGATVGAVNSVTEVEPGDSGGPVVGFPRGDIYGIISYRQRPMQRGLPFFMGYTPTAQFFSEQPNYALAPP